MSRAASGTEERTWRWLAYAYGLLAALGVAYFLVQVPFQVSDNLGNMLKLQELSFWELMRSKIHEGGYLRPMLWGQIKVLFDLAQGRYFLTFKAYHASQLVAVALLFTRLLRVRSVGDLVAVPVATAVLFGIHTFRGTVCEAHPASHFLTIILACVVAVNLCFSRPRWWKDVAAVGTLLFAAFCIETGLLVWVCVVASYLVGARGVSVKGVVAATVAVAFYMILRFVVLDVGTPGLIERESGFGFSRRQPEDLVALFGRNPYGFYLYNVVCSLLTVLLSEPRGGVWEFTRELLHGGMPAWRIIHLTSSVLATAVIVRFVHRRYRRWLRGEVDHGDRLVLVFLVVLAANAVMSYAYTKDEIMSVAGVFYALALYAAARDLLAWLGSVSGQALVAGALAVVLLALSATWSVRWLGLCYSFRVATSRNQHDWFVVDDWIEEELDGTAISPEGRRLIERLRAQALAMEIPNPLLTERWAQRLFDAY